ncbi:hypothetical protein CPC08DRAFT_712226 [Agrocybe pediades]|nr:hypothetical protein CPC08DRAFT_712226 [Agrocybe pediades]
MYPSLDGRAGQYIPLSHDLEHDELEQQQHYAPRSRLRRITKARWFRPAVFTFIVIFLVTLFWHTGWKKRSRRRPAPEVDWVEDAFEFEGHEKPHYLDAPMDRPVVIRLSIMSRVDEFETRQTLRETMLDGIKPSEVKLDYKFFVGRAEDEEVWKELRPRILKESDVVILDHIVDIKPRLSEKRFEGVKWAASVPHDQYDYAMTLDSDTFCRFHVLAKRLRHIYSDVNPREKPALLGRMLQHRVYFLNTVPDDDEDPTRQDEHLAGPWYDYPGGIGYVLSSNLTATIINVEPPVAHHVLYPGDDVMIGSWVGCLRHFPDPNVQFMTTIEPFEPAYPKPYYPYSIDTRIINEVVAWHDFKGRGGHNKSIGWESTCIHKITLDEMRAFREMKEVRDEWDDV